jgi:type II secretory pathway component GspD/PulD (secretin)
MLKRITQLFLLTNLFRSIYGALLNHLLNSKHGVITLEIKEGTVKSYLLYKTGLLLLLLSLSGLAFAQRVEIIEVQHRPAEDIAQQIKALYPEQYVHIAGSHQQLTVRANDTVINEIKQLVHTFDVPLRQFLIIVSTDQNINTSEQNLGVSTISSTTRSSGSINSKKTYQTRGDGNQSITVLEGHSARLNTGQKKPVQTRQFLNGQWVNTIEYIDMTSGVYVKPRLIGSDRVELKIYSHKNEASKVHHREINTSTFNTVRIVGLGEWVNIGGVSYDSRDKQGSITYSSKQSDVDKQSMMIKIELLPD